MNVMLTFLLTDFFLSELGYVQKKNIQRKMTFISWVDRGLVSWYLSRSIYDVKIIIINVANDEADFLFSFSFWSRICKINAFFFCCFWVEWKKIFTFFLNHDLFQILTKIQLSSFGHETDTCFFFFILLQIIFWREKNSSSS